MTSPALSIVILAAGKGTRMKSDKAKVLHEVFFAPMVQHVVNAVLPLQATRTVIVVGHQAEAVEKALQAFPCQFAIQEQQLGTGHAVLAAGQAIQEDTGTVMILCGDTPLIRTETLAQMYAAHIQSRATTLTLMTTILDNPTNYGRIMTGLDDKVLGIVEQKDASPEQLQIQEVNAGIYCVDKTFLFSALEKVGTNNSQKEVYLTDIVKQAVEAGLKVEKFVVTSPTEVLGVNSRVELADAQLELQLRRNRALMLQGVTIYNPQTVAISPDVKIGNDTVLEAGVRITGNSEIGQGSRIGQGAILQNCRIGDRTVIGPYSCLSEITVAADRTLPPFSCDC
ncbi:MAG: NTP transferase domain-containing protein [Proteobacteria bacterium]|nr:NTP transferase domain-containing protein [Pseudomonadota bacterium]